MPLTQLTRWVLGVGKKMRRYEASHRYVIQIARRCGDYLYKLDHIGGKNDYADIIDSNHIDKWLTIRVEYGYRYLDAVDMITPWGTRLEIDEDLLIKASILS